MTSQSGQRQPGLLRLAAAVHVVEAAEMIAATAFSAAATIGGKAYETSSGIALTILAFIAAVSLAVIAVGIAKAQPWSRMPAVICQLFVVIGGVMLLQGHRYVWGVPALILAAAGLAGLLAPPSIKALNRSR
jgi:hypothetical protein